MFPGPLRVFYEVSRAGSIRKASDAMGVAPSSVSRQVAILERQMGTKLVERSSEGISLTHAGELVAGYARRVVHEFDSLKVDLDDMRGSRRLIRLATVESVVSAGPCQVMADFHQKFDGVTFRLSMLPAPQVVDAIKKDLADVGIAMNPAPDPEVQVLAVVPEPIVLAVSADHPLAACETVPLEMITGIDLGLPDESFGIRRILEGVVNAAGLRLGATMTANTFEALRDYVQTGRAGAILPLRAVETGATKFKLKAVAIDSAPLREGAIHVITCRERRLPRIIKLFADELVKRLKEA